jgi:hypothetical protein
MGCCAQVEFMGLRGPNGYRAAGCRYREVSSPTSSRPECRQARDRDFFRRRPGLQEVEISAGAIDRFDGGLVSAQAVKRTRLARGKSLPPLVRNSVPCMPGMRWSESKIAASSPRNFSCWRASSAEAPEVEFHRAQDFRFVENYGFGSNSTRR